MSKYAVSYCRYYNTNNYRYKDEETTVCDVKVFDDFGKAKKYFRKMIVSAKISFSKKEIADFFPKDPNGQDITEQFLAVINGICKKVSYQAPYLADYSSKKEYDVHYLSKTGSVFYVKSYNEHGIQKLMQTNCWDIEEDGKTYYFNYIETYFVAPELQHCIFLKKVQD